MSEEQRFNEAMQDHTIEADSRGRVLHFGPPWIQECDLCGSKDEAGDQVEYNAGDTTIRLCPECR